MQSGNVKIAQFLIDNGAKATTRYHQDLTNLHMAAKNNDLRMLDLLVNSDIDFKYMLDVQSESGYTPAHIAAANNHFDTISFLREQGSNFRLKDK